MYFPPFFGISHTDSHITCKRRRDSFFLPNLYCCISFLGVSSLAVGGINDPPNVRDASGQATGSFGWPAPDLPHLQSAETAVTVIMKESVTAGQTAEAELIDPRFDRVRPTMGTPSPLLCSYTTFYSPSETSEMTAPTQAFTSSTQVPPERLTARA